MNKIGQILGMWSCHNLTIKGKAIIVNTLALSKVWHLASVHVPRDNICERIEEAITKSIWTSKTRVAKKRSIVHMPDDFGGINFVSILRRKQKHLK